MSYRLTRIAAEDIRRIYRSGETRFGQRHAEAYHINLERTLELLASNPKLARQRLEIMPPVRVHPFGHTWSSIMTWRIKTFS